MTLRHAFVDVDRAVVRMDRSELPVVIDPRHPLFDHAVHAQRLLPAAACWDIALGAAAAVMSSTPAGLANVSLRAPFRPGAKARVMLAWRHDVPTFEIVDGARSLCAGEVVLEPRPTDTLVDLVALGQRCTREFSIATLYQQLEKRGMHHGPAMHAVTSLRVGDAEAFGALHLPSLGRLPESRLQPALLDAAMQVAAAWLLDRWPDRDGMYVPFHVEAIRALGEIPDRGLSQVTFYDVSSDEVITCDVRVLDETGRVVLAVEKLSFKRVSAEQLARLGDAVPLQEVRWVEEPSPPGALPSRVAVVCGDVRLRADLVTRLRAEGLTVTDKPEGGAAVVVMGEGIVDTVRLLRSFVEHRPRLILVASPTSDEPDHGLVFGLCRALSDELVGTAVRAVASERPRLVENVLSELRNDDAGCAWWRGGTRTVARAQALTHVADLPAFRPHDAILITGGGRGIGAEVARYVARNIPCTLVLVGRAPSVQRATLIDELESYGASVRYLSLDVADEASASAIGGAVEAIGKLDGVIHAAGVVKPGRFIKKTDEEIEAVLSPKVTGLRNLKRALGDRCAQLRFFALFSSASTVVNGIGGGLTDYVAANAWLDAAAQLWGRPFVSISWSAWAEAGMAADADIGGALQARGILPLSTELALDALERALGSGARHVLVIEQRQPARRAALDVKSSAPSETVEILLRDAVAEQLAVTPAEVPLDEPFTSLGLDSLAALDIARSLEESGIEALQPTLLFEYPTIRSLAAHLANRPGRSAPKAAPIAVSEEPFDVTDVQHAFLINHRLHDDVTAYSFLRQTIDGPLDVTVLRRVLRMMEERHPMLRARFFMGARTARQRFAASDYAWFSTGELDGDLGAAEEELVNTHIDLERSPPLRVRLLCESPSRAHLLTSIHHIAADAWSLNVLAEDTWHAYNDVVAGREPALPRIASTFRDVVEEERRERDGDDAERDRRWWLERLSKEPSVELPCDGEPSSRRLCSHQCVTDESLTTALTRMAAESGVSVFQLLLAVQFAVVHEWTGWRRFAVNVAHARRHLRVRGVERLVGCFADTLPVHADVDGQMPVIELAKRLRNAWMEVQGHHRVTSVDLARALRPVDGSPRVAAPVSFSFARFPVDKPRNAPIDIVATSGATASAATRLGLAGWELKGVLHFSWNFPSWLFKRETVARIAARHLEMLRELSADAPSSRRAFVQAHRLVVAQSLRTPDATAVWQDGRAWSYRDVDEQSAAVASAIAAQDMRGSVVGLLAHQGFAAIAAITGILRAGAAWLPLDVEHPVARLSTQLQLTGATTVLCERSMADLARSLESVQSVLIIDDVGAVDGFDDVEVDPDATAYVIFTSGSTGIPKGVPITHRAMAHYLDFAIRTFDYRAEDRMAQTSSLCFDASVRQVLVPLMVGATCVVVPRDVARDPELLLDLVERAGVTVWSSVPSLLERLTAVIEKRVRPPDLSRVRHVHVGGEALHASLVRRWFDASRSKARLTNLYGPTEVTINATWHEVEQRPGDDVTRIPIGRPLPGRRLRIVGDDGKERDEGELLVGGIGLTAGYLGPASLSERAFVHEAGERWYRTGDRVRRLPEGTLEFLGRVDDQVKIRGHRIEPGEIEAALARHPSVALAAVVALDRGTSVALEGFVTTRAAADETGLKQHLRSWLPAYMIPTRVHVVDEMPMTSTGKIDRARLVRSSAGVEAPSTPVLLTKTESLLAEVWSSVLRVTVADPEADFFDLGGDSVATLEVFAELEKHRSPLPRPTVLYRARTLRALAALLDGDVARARQAHTPVEFPLSPAQRGFVLSEATHPSRPLAWCASVSLPLAVDPALLQRAVDILVERHAMLRTVVMLDRRPLVQRTLTAPGVLPVVVERCGSVDDVDRVRAREGVRPFRLDEWPLMRLVVCDVDGGSQHLVVCAHHLIGDAASFLIIANELVITYRAVANGVSPSLPVLRSGFADCVAMAGAVTRPEASSWWKETFAEPYGVPPSAAQRRNVRLELDVDPARVKQLRVLARQHRTSLHGVLLALFFSLLRRTAGRRDLVVAAAIDGRHLPVDGIENVVGPLATVLPIRCDVDEKPWEELVPQVSGAFQKARANVAFPVEILQWVPGLSPSIVQQYVFSFMEAGSGDVIAVSGMVDVPDGTDAFLAVRASGDRLHVDLRAPGLPADIVDDLRTSLSVQPMRRKSVVRMSREFGTVEKPVSAALIGYLPPVPGGAVLKGVVGQVLFGGRRHVILERLTTSLGASAYIAIPWFADDLMAANREVLIADVEHALRVAQRQDARSVSLAGLIPSLTDYGFALSSDAVTTGHAATVVSVVKNTLSALESVGRGVEDEVLGVAGVGSIGRSALRLLLRVAPHPREILLLDSRGSAVAALERELHDVDGYSGRITMLTTTRGAPEPFYRASVVLGATSAPSVVDIRSLRPGTIVVDDSFPHCFDVDAALERMRVPRDVLITGGGLLDCGDLQRDVFLPSEGEPFKERVMRHMSVGGVAGCQLEPLLRVANPRLPAIRGLVDVDTALQYWRATEDLGIVAAPLHLGEEVLDATQLSVGRRS